MKKLLLFSCLFFSASYCDAQHVTLSGKDFKLNGQDFYPVVMNYRSGFYESENQCLNGLTTTQQWFNAPDASMASEMQRYKNDCQDSNSCRDLIKAHFKKIRSSGFNTLRLLASPFINHNTIVQTYKAHIKGTYCGHSYVESSYMLQNDFQDDVTERVIWLMKDLMDIAHEEDLMVIYLALDNGYEPNPDLYPGFSGSSSPVWGVTAEEQDENVQRYSNWLAALSSSIGDHPALLAYDLWNEPAWEEAMWSVTKAQVCEFTTRWYDSIKSGNPNALVTIGLADMDDIFIWDPAFVKVDFISPHFYPGVSFHDDHSVSKAVDRLLDRIYYYSQISVKPWIIGETGFSADDAITTAYYQLHNGHNGPILNSDPVLHAYPFMHGDEEDQVDYAVRTMDAVRLLGGSGYSWWDFKNSKTKTAAKAYFEGPAGYGAQFWGIIKHCRPCDYTDPALEKLVVTTFRERVEPPPLPAVPPPSPTYFNSMEFDPANGIEASGYVLDQNGDPVQHGLVRVIYLYEYPEDEQPEEESERIPPLGIGIFIPIRPSDGYFEIPRPDINYPDIQINNVQYEDRERKRFDITTIGGDVVQYGTGDIPSTTYLTVNLPQEEISISNLSVVGPYQQQFANYLDFTNLTMDTPELIEIKAKYSISINTESHIINGSNVHLYLASGQLDCADHQWKNLSNHFPTLEYPGSTRENVTETLNLQFLLPCAISIYPNPILDHGMIETECAGEVSLWNAQGCEILRMDVKQGRNILPLDRLQAGWYILRYYQEDHDLGHTLPFIKLN